MKKQLLKMSAFLVISSLLFTACKKDKPEENDEEVITTMRLTFLPIGGGAAISFQYDDADGPGGAAPTQDSIKLLPNKSYNVSLQLLNKTANPITDITTEVKDEKDAHRFYYEPSAASNITVSGLDIDAAGIPLGVTSTWASGVATVGKLKITLRHYPGTPPNKALGDLVNSSKSATDIEVEFNTKIQ